MDWRQKEQAKASLAIASIIGLAFLFVLSCFGALGPSCQGAGLAACETVRDLTATRVIVYQR